MSLLVTDGDQRSTLAVVRALGRAGITVAVGADQPVSLAGSSRYCARTVCYPSPLLDPQGFQAFLQQEVASGQYRMLLPMTDVTAQLLSQVRETISPTVSVPIPGAQQVKRVQDKRHMTLLALQLGIPCPQSFMLQDHEQLEEVARRVSYPAVVKPRFSRYLQGAKWMFGTVHYARDAAELIARYQEIHQQIPGPLVQEKVEGEGRGVFLLLWDGALKAAFCHRRLREKPPWGGVSVYSESIPLDEELVRASFNLLAQIGWQGVAMVEFKLDGRNGTAKFIEVNGRFWGSLQLAIDAGINFPMLLYRLAMGENPPPQFIYKVGARSRWLLGDLDHLIILLTHSRAPNGLPCRRGSKLRACADFLRLFERNMHYDVLRREDLAPGWFECKSYLADTWRKVFSGNKEISAT